MDEPEIELLRSFRADAGTAPAALGTRIEGELWAAIRREEQATRRGQRRLMRHARQAQRTRRTRTILASAGVAAAVLLVTGLNTDALLPGGQQAADTAASTAGTISVPDTAARLFRTQTAAAGTPTASTSMPVALPMAGVHDGPRRDPATGALDARTQQIVAAAPLDAEALWTAIQASLATAGVRDPDHRQGFLAAMRWVVAPDVPSDLRAAMFRTLSSVRGLETTASGTDVLGRSGIVVGHLDTTAGTREQFLLDTRTGQLFEHRAYTTATLDPNCPAGTLIAHDLYAGYGIRIEPAYADWVLWPQVTPSCMTDS